MGGGGAYLASGMKCEGKGRGVGRDMKGCGGIGSVIGRDVNKLLTIY